MSFSFSFFERVGEQGFSGAAALREVQEYT